MVFGLWKSLSSGSRFSLGPRCLSALSGQCYQSVSGARYIKAYFIAGAPAPALSPATHTRANAPRSRDEREQRRQTRDRLRERESLAHVSVPLTCVYLSGPCLSLRAHPRTPARVLSVPSVGPAGGAPELTRRPRIGTLPVLLCGRCPQLCSPWGSSSYRVMSNTWCI